MTPTEFIQQKIEAGDVKKDDLLKNFESMLVEYAKSVGQPPQPLRAEFLRAVSKVYIEHAQSRPKGAVELAQYWAKKRPDIVS